MAAKSKIQQIDHPKLNGPINEDSPQLRQPSLVDESYKIAIDALNCEVHTLLYRPHNGFANYTIATITIKDGKVTDIQYSEPYNGTESLIRMDMLNGRLLEKMRRNYPAGFTFV